MPATASALEITTLSPDQAFSPNADGQEDTTSRGYRLSERARVSIRIETEAGTPVRQIQTDRPTTGDAYFEWDGRGDSGSAAVADGTYRYRITGETEAGETATATGLIGVDTAPVGAWTLPVADEELTGTTRVAISPHPGRTINWVYVRTCPWETRCGYAGVGWLSGPGLDGAWSTDWDTGTAWTGDHFLDAEISYVDTFGSSHTYRLDLRHVTVTRPAQITLQSPDRAFSPDADGSEDSHTIGFALTAPATTTIRIRNATGQIVRRVETDVARGEGSHSFTWDGRDDEGATVPDGTYEYTIDAASRGQTASATGRIGVDTRPVAQITTPGADEELTGEVRVTVTPAAGRTLTGVYGGTCPWESFCNYYSLGWFTDSVLDDTFVVDWNTAATWTGTHHIGLYAYYNDEFGQSHALPLPVRRVTVVRPAEVRATSPDATFSPDGDGQEDTHSAGYQLTAPADVTIRIRNAADTVVRTIETAEPREESWHSFTWDGRDGDGTVLPDGTYRYTIDAASRGTTATAGGQIGIDTAPIGEWAAPAERATLTGTAELVVRPAAGRTLTGASASACSNWSCWNWLGWFSGPGEDGTWRLGWDTAQAAVGDVTLSTYVTWTDRFGTGHQHTLPQRQVSVTRDVAISNVSPDRAFSPNGDEQEDTHDVGYHLSAPASVTVRIRDADGAVVRRIETDEARGEGWNSFRWDGRDDSGTVVRDGTYSFTITSGEASASGRIGVDTQPVAEVRRPATDEVVSGTTSIAVKPVGGRIIDGGRVYTCPADWWCGSWYDYVGELGPMDFDGTRLVDWNTTPVPTGERWITSSVWYTDAFGQSHTYNLPRRRVTVTRAVQITNVTADRYITPDGDGTEDIGGPSFCINASAHVRLAIRGADGEVLQTYESDLLEGCQFPFAWDGTRSDGTPAPDGSYAYTLTATGNDDTRSTYDGRIGVRREPVGDIVRPAVDDVLSRTAQFEYAPRSGLTTLSVRPCVRSTCASITTAGTGGRWATSLDLTSSANGPTELTNLVRWRDAYGSSHETTQRVAVTLDTAAPQVELTLTPAQGEAPLRTTGQLAASITTGRTLNYRIDYGDGSDAVTGQLASPYTAVPLAHEFTAAGTYRVRVDVNDGQGNGAQRSTLVTVNPPRNVAPTATLSVSPAEGESPLQVTLTPDGTDADEDPLTFRLDYGDGSDVVEGTLPTAPRTHTYTQGSYQARLTVSDGRFSTTVTRLVTAVDSTPPQTTVSDAPEGPQREIPTFTLSSSESPARFECQVDLGAFTTCASPYTPTGLGDGAHTIKVRAVDEAGNRDATPESRSFTLDRTPPTVTVTSGPSGPTTSSTATFAFNASESVTRFECDVQDDGFVPCTSPQVYSGLTDGAYTFRVRAFDVAGNGSDPVRRTFVVDTAPPETTLTSTPDPVTKATSVSYAFSSSEGGAAFECRLDDAAFAPCTSPTSLTELAEGDHTFAVRAIDATGQRDATPALHTFEVDRTAPQTVIDAGPDAPVHGKPQFSFSADEYATFECAIDTGAWFACGGLTELPETAVGEHTFRVRAIDRAGNVDPTPATRTFTLVNVAPTATITVDAPTGVAPHDVELLVDGADADDDPLTYTIDWGDGDRTSSASLPMAYAEHRYAKAGTYVVRVEVRDAWDSTVETTTVRVAPGEPLEARAGDDRTGPAGDPIRFDAGNSRPLAGVDSFRWDFGDGASATTAVASHTYAAPGTYEAKLTVKQGDDTDTDTVTVRVLPAGPTGLGVTVTSGGSAIPEADALVITPDGERIQAVTGEDGKARLRGLRDGTYSVAVYAPGYLPKRADATVADGSGSVSVELQAGNLAEAKLTSRPMTLQEILAAGIDPSDPANQNVYQFTVNLQLTPDGPPATFTGGYGAGGGGGGGGGTLYGLGGLTCRSRSACVGTSGGSTVYVRAHTGPAGTPLLTTLVIPFRASWLKEFFDVSMTVANLADPGFTLTGGAATIELPAGLTLAPTAERQSVTKQMPDIPGGGQATARWVLRGDEEGQYNFGADYGAVLDPIGRSFTLRAELDDPLRVWGGSALQLIVDVDERGQDRYPFTTRVGLKNVADVPVYNPAVELLKEGRRGYIEQPRQQRVFSTQEISPGETFWAGPFVIIPEESGAVDLSRSFLRKTAGNVDLQGTIVTHPRVPTFDDAPELNVTGRLNGLVFEYDPVQGATGYEAYATPDRETDFPNTPLTMRTIRPGVGYVADVAPAEQPPHFAIRPVAASGDEMVHPLATANATSTAEYPKVTATTTSRCSERPVDVKLSFEDPIFELSHWRYRIDGGAWQDGGALTGFEHDAIVSLEIPPGEEQRYEVQVHNRDEGADGQGIWGPIEELDLGGCSYVALGDSFSAGEGVRPYEDGTNGDDSGGSGSRCHRSRDAYPQLLANVSVRAFVACSGAVSGDLHKAQNDNVGTAQSQHAAREPLNDGVGPQLDAISGSTQLVTISMGGNDVGFGDILADCAFSALQDWWNRVRSLSTRPFALACKSNWAGKLSDRQAQLENDLHDAFLRIKLKAADHARVIALGYPQIFPDFAVDKVQCWLFHPADVNWFHRMTQSVNESVERAAATAGIEYVDPNEGGRFDGHSVCDATAAHFNHAFHNIGGDVTEWGILDKEESFHPNRAGQAALAAALQDALDEAPGSRRAVLKPKDTWDFASEVFDDWDVLGVRIGWPGSEMALKLTSPSGTEFTTSSTGPGIQTATTPTTAEIRIKNPEPGTWKVTVTAVDVAPDGEPVTADITHATKRDEPPVALAAGHPGDAIVQGTTVRYSAEGSFDPDGSISQYLWDFGDGGRRTGAEVTYTHNKVGTFSPTLTVTDDKGNTDTMPLLPLKVNAKDQAPPPPPPPPPPPVDPDAGNSGGGSSPTPGSSAGASGGAAVPPGGSAPPGSTSVPPTSKLKLFGRISAPKFVRLSALKQRGLKVKVRGVQRGVRLRGELRLAGARGRTVAIATLTVSRGGTATLVLKPSRSATRRLRRSQRLKLTLSAKLGRQSYTAPATTVALR